MKIQKILKPGQPGTKKLAKQYGENLICVRYRCDPVHKRKLKTIELVIESQPWQPNAENIPMNKLMNIKVAIEEQEFVAPDSKWLYVGIIPIYSHKEYCFSGSSINCYVKENQKKKYENYILLRNKFGWFHRKKRWRCLLA